MQNFKEWIAKYKDEDTIKGDLARDILRDKNFPETNDKEQIFNYIETQLHRHGISHAFKDFKSMYASYLKSHPL
jgi:uncharacterized protein YozE (UPF0346 family)